MSGPSHSGQRVGDRIGVHLIGRGGEPAAVKAAMNMLKTGETLELTHAKGKHYTFQAMPPTILTQAEVGNLRWNSGNKFLLIRPGITKTPTD